MSRLIDRTGEENINKQGLRMCIKEYRNRNDIDIEFEDGYVAKNKKYNNFKKGTINNINFMSSKINNLKGKIFGRLLVLDIDKEKMNNRKDGDRNSYWKCKCSCSKNNIVTVSSKDLINENTKSCGCLFIEVHNRMRKTLFGKGFIGDSCVSEKGKIKKSYQIWRNMLSRCYNEDFTNKHKTYKDCTVCEEWHNFSTFEKWFDENYYKVDNEQMNLDKDIICHNLQLKNKIYSPETCVFVPKSINSLFTKNDKDRGDYLIGVSKVSNSNNPKQYQASLGYLNKSKCFETELEAFNWYKEEKEKLIKQIAEEYKDKIPKILYEAMYAWKVEIDD